MQETESWIQLLNRLEVMTEQGVRMCDDCGKRIAEVQHRGIRADLSVVDTRKLCTVCHESWKKHARLVVR